MHMRKLLQMHYVLPHSSVTIYSGCHSNCWNRATAVQGEHIIRFCCCGRTSDSWDNEIAKWQHMLAYDLWQITHMLVDLRDNLVVKK
jgi:hypothetical protein